jgi:hypothetical protein
MDGASFGRGYKHSAKTPQKTTQVMFLDRFSSVYYFAGPFTHRASSNPRGPSSSEVFGALTHRSSGLFGSVPIP